MLACPPDWLRMSLVLGRPPDGLWARLVGPAGLEPATKPL